MVRNGVQVEGWLLFFVRESLWGGKYGLRHTWRIDGLRIVFQKVSKKRKIDECAEIMPFRGKYGLRHTWRMVGLRIKYRVVKNGVRG